MAQHTEMVIIGGGIVGLATAAALLRQRRRSLVLLEAEDRLAAHQTGHNSGVIHAGVYYRPGSLKARLSVEGRDALYAFCHERGIPHERCGKLIVATVPGQVEGLAELERRGEANGLRGLRRCGPDELREREPHAAGVAALVVAETGIVDYPAVAQALAASVTEMGGEIRTRARVHACSAERSYFSLHTAADEVRARNLVNCAGLESDRIARLCGSEPGVRIIPFRGEYYHLKDDRRHLVRGLIYPVPDPALPFLGVHFTRTIHGAVEAGPNAVLALARDGYRWSRISAADCAEMAASPHFWRMLRHHWRSGLGELRRSLSKRAFVRSLQALVPDVRSADLSPGGAGVRAQAVARDGRLLDDFHFAEGPGMLHVLNAPSPAATAALAIGRVIAGRATALEREA